MPRDGPRAQVLEGPHARREREIAAQLATGKTSKQIGRVLDISSRTVDIYRARLMRKYGTNNTPELLQRLLGQ